MSRAKVAFVAWLFATSLCAQSAPSPDLPAGAMENRARTACTSCHDTRIVVQQRLTKTAWGKEVDKMIKWGAIVDAADRDALVDYLSTNFPPEKPAYVAPRLASPKSKVQ
jgi:hypothetical protein